MGTPGVLPGVVAEIQAGLLATLLSNVWLPALKMALRFDERKVCAMGIVKLMGVAEIAQNPQLMSGCFSALVTLLGLMSSTSVKHSAEDGSDDEGGPADGGAGLDYEVSFNKLRNTDLPGAAAGLAPDVVDLPNAVKAALQPQRGVLTQLAQAHAELQPLLVFLQ